MSKLLHIYPSFLNVRLDISSDSIINRSGDIGRISCVLQTGSLEPALANTCPLLVIFLDIRSSGYTTRRQYLPFQSMFAHVYPTSVYRQR